MARPPGATVDPGIRTTVRRPATSVGPSAPVIALVCGVLAFAMRFARVGGVAGLRGYGTYDDGVYFAAATALVHGRVPYRDFLFLHPPGIVVALAPVAGLTHWTSDAGALAAARLAVIALGAVNTALVVLVAAPLGRRAAGTAGVLYALLPVATEAESLTFLEPLGTTALLAAVLLARRAERPTAGPWASVAAGAVLGVAPMTKIWGVATVAVVLVWHGLRAGRAAALRATAGVAATVVVVTAPFAVLAGGALWRDVVVAQLDRRDDLVGLVPRLEAVTGGVTSDLAEPGRLVVAVWLLAFVVTCAVVAWRARTGRLWVALLAVQGGLLLVAPAFYPRYAALVAPAVVLVVAGAVAAVPVAARTVAAVAACGLVVAATGATTAPTTVPFPAAAVRHLLPDGGCVRSDSPATLALADVLSRDLDRGCTVQVDLSGLSYRHPAVAAGGPVVRRDNPHYQRAAAAYLSSGSATVLVRGRGDAFAPQTLRRIYADHRHTRLHGYVRVLVGTAATGARAG